MINDYDLTKLGGWENHVNDLMHLLQSKWIEVELLHWEMQHKKRDSMYNFDFQKKLSQFLENKTFDVIHLHSISRNISVSFLKCLKEKWFPIIMTVHSFAYNCPKSYWIREWKMCMNKNILRCLSSQCLSYSNNTWLIKYLEDSYKVIKINFHLLYLKKYIDLFICPSRLLQDSLIQRLGSNINKVLYIPNFIQIKEEIVSYDNTDIKKFIYVWRLSREKWINTLIDAFDTIINYRWISDISLEIIWEWDEKEKIATTIKSRGLEKNIHLLWRIPNTELKAYYESAAAVIIPSICLENNPLVGIEWMRFWRPLIWSNIWWIPDLIQDGENWYLFEPWNKADLADKIISLYSNEELIEKMGKMSNIKVKNEFSSEEYFKKILDVYNSLI